MNRYASAAAVAALTLALAGCGGNSSVPEDEDGNPITPLTEFYQALSSGQTQEDYDAMAREAENLTAECMADLGFTYLPVDQNQGTSFSSDDLDVEWGSREFAEQYGYGATTDPWGSLYEASEPQEWVDPNQDYVESMSDSEREAYYAALYGEQTYDENDESTWEYNWETAGCQGAAQHEVYEAEQPWSDPEYEALIEDMNRIYESVESDSRVAEANAAWSECMADAGFPGFATTADAQNSIYERLNAIWDNTDYSEASTEEDYTRIQEQIDAQQAEITPEEIAMAVADYDCQQEADVTNVRLQAQIDAEQTFVDAHRTELDALIAAYGSSGSSESPTD